MRSSGGGGGNSLYIRTYLNESERVRCLDLEVLVDQRGGQVVGEDVEREDSPHPQSDEDPLAPGEQRGGGGASIEARTVVGSRVGQVEDVVVAQEDAQREVPADDVAQVVADDLRVDVVEDVGHQHHE